MADLPKFNDHIQVLAYKTAVISMSFSSDPMTPYFNDHLQVLVYKIAQNLLNGGGGGGSNIVVETPSNTTDFSGLPNGVAPTGDTVFFAPRDSGTIWTIAGGDTAWTVIDKNIP